MKTILFLVFVSAAVVAGDADIDKLMAMDFETILSDSGRRKQAFDCMMDRAPCGPYQIMRDRVPGLVETNCGGCTPAQRKKYDEVNLMLLQKYPNEYQQIMLKYALKINQ